MRGENDIEYRLSGGFGVKVDFFRRLNSDELEGIGALDRDTVTNQIVNVDYDMIYEWVNRVIDSALEPFNNGRG
jgi:hypothetical protein